MTAPLLHPWTDDQRRLYRRENVRFRQRLHETGLFEDDALARLIERHPRDRLDVLTMGRDKTNPDSWAAGDWEHLDGLALVNAVHTGRLWVNIRGAMLTDPEYRAAFDRLLADFQRETRGPKVLKASAGVLLSSPGVQVFYHCDRTDTMLWHLRGEKTIWLWPTEQAWVADVDYEKLVLKETKEDLPYRPDFDAHAAAVTLRPGDAVSWPLHGPHRVENGDSTNVSVTIEYGTLDSTLTNAVFFTHGVLRRRLGWDLRSRGVPGVAKPAYLAASRLLRPFAPKVDAYKAHGRTFTVDPAAPDSIRWHAGEAMRAAA